VLRPGDAAPSFSLPEIDGAGTVDDPWREGPVVLAFFKVTCPVCRMAAPKVRAMADGGARVVGVGQDPRPALVAYRDRFDQLVPTVPDTAPYPVSSAYGLAAVPTLFLVGPDGVVADAVAGWDREGWNRVAAAAGASPVSADGDGLPPFRPG
jgi:peroxiredoxin